MSRCDEVTRVQSERLCRRQFLRLGVFAAVAGIAPRAVFASVEPSSKRERSVSFYETHTKESLTTVYWVDGRYLPGALTDINHVLRDFRTDEVTPIDTGLLDLVYAIKMKLKAQGPFHVISGYRSPRTNAMLRKRNPGVAKNSLHQYGKAVDIRLPGSSLPLIRRVAMELRAGGVGYYPRSNFVHIDVGRVRTW